MGVTKMPSTTAARSAGRPGSLGPGSPLTTCSSMTAPATPPLLTSARSTALNSWPCVKRVLPGPRSPDIISITPSLERNYAPKPSIVATWDSFITKAS